MTDDPRERIRTLRHDLSNPLAAILAQTQLLLMRGEELDADTVESLKEIEGLARRMRQLLQEA